MDQATTPRAASVSSEAKSQPFNYRAGDSVKGSDSTDTARRTSRLSVCARRVKFLARFIYWTFRHGSTEHAGWVCNYEGLYW